MSNILGIEIDGTKLPLVSGDATGRSVDPVTGRIAKLHQIEGWSAFELGEWLHEQTGVRILSRTTIDTIMREQVARDLFGGGNKHYGLAFGVVTEKGVACGGG